MKFLNEASVNRRNFSSFLKGIIWCCSNCKLHFQKVIRLLKLIQCFPKYPNSIISLTQMIRSGVDNYIWPIILLHHDSAQYGGRCCFNFLYSSWPEPIWALNWIYDSLLGMQHMLPIIFSKLLWCEVIFNQIG